MYPKFLLASALCATGLGFAAQADTTYPLTLENCGSEVTFDKAPETTVTVGQAATEVLYSLGWVKRSPAPRSGSPRCSPNLKN